jgi:hypothetical protein
VNGLRKGATEYHTQITRVLYSQKVHEMVVRHKRVNVGAEAREARKVGSPKTDKACKRGGTGEKGEKARQGI